MMIVDDKKIGATVKVIMEKNDYKTVTCDPESCIGKLKLKPELILLTNPKILTKNLKETIKRKAGIKVAYINDEELSKEEAKRTFGGSNVLFIREPFDIDEFAERIKDFVR